MVVLLQLFISLQNNDPRNIIDDAVEIRLEFGVKGYCMSFLHARNLAIFD